MNNKIPYDLLVECRSCGIENSIVDYVPSMRIFCSQCRERLIDADIIETHCEYVCQKCDMKMVLLQATEVKPGESACSCGSTDLLKVGKTTLPDEAAKAGGLIDLAEDDDNVLEDTDWLRSDLSEIDDDNYDDMFNQDPGHH